MVYLRLFPMLLGLAMVSETYALGARAPRMRRQLWFREARSQVQSPPRAIPPQVIQGWLPEYSEHVETTVEAQYPRLLELSASRLSRVCPNWSRMERAERREFWSALLWSISGPESGRNRTLVYVEGTMSKDPVTGYQVRSEGLLQLSYQDIVSYKYRGGDISWERDREHARRDYDSRVKYGTPERTILDAYANLNLGLWIVQRRLLDFDANRNLPDALGKYWYVMQTRNAEEFGRVLANLRARLPTCFR